MEQTLARPLTRAQQARRQRVIDAAMALGLEGGYEAVQMRDVAAKADVAMGTVYRYFTSKDHLLAATLVHWVELLDSRIAQHLEIGTSYPTTISTGWLSGIWSADAAWRFSESEVTRSSGDRGMPEGDLAEAQWAAPAAVCQLWRPAALSTAIETHSQAPDRSPHWVRDVGTATTTATRPTSAPTNSSAR